jgi:hypothetical protein
MNGPATIVVFAVALVVVFSCSAPAAVLASSEDGEVRVTDRMMREAFDAFCASTEAAGRCGEFEEYRHDIFGAEDFVGVWHIFEEPDLMSPEPSVGCMWLKDRTECHFG